MTKIVLHKVVVLFPKQAQKAVFLVAFSAEISYNSKMEAKCEK